MEKNLDHLTSEEIETLMQRYYAGESVSKLTKEYGISVRSSNLYKLFPPEVFPNYICEYCDEPLVINRPSKTMKNLPKYERDLYCPVCGHKPFQTHCNCENCQEEERIDLLPEVTDKRWLPAFFHALYLLSIKLSMFCNLEYDMYVMKILIANSNSFYIMKI